MNRYSIQITSKALDDMERIYNYIAVQLMAPEAAIKQYNQIAEAIEKLYIFPERIKIIESEPERSMGLRSKIVKKRTPVPVTIGLSYFFIDISMVTGIVFAGDNY